MDGGTHGIFVFSWHIDESLDEELDEWSQLQSLELLDELSHDFVSLELLDDLSHELESLDDDESDDDLE